MTILITGAFLIILIYLILERRQALRDRAALSHVVHVNGIRGKSTVTRLIEAGLRALPQEFRAVLLLREIHQRSYDEIADILDLDLGTVKSRINRGRKQLRKFLLESGNFSGFPASKGTGEEGCR